MNKYIKFNNYHRNHNNLQIAQNANTNIYPANEAR